MSSCFWRSAMTGGPSYDTEAAQHFASLGCPVFACTPDQFPDMMAVALQKGDMAAWAAGQGIACVRGGRLCGKRRFSERRATRLLSDA